MYFLKIQKASRFSWERWAREEVSVAWKYSHPPTRPCTAAFPKRLTAHLSSHRRPRDYPSPQPYTPCRSCDPPRACRTTQGYQKLSDGKRKELPLLATAVPFAQDQRLNYFVVGFEGLYGSLPELLAAQGGNSRWRFYNGS